MKARVEHWKQQAREQDLQVSQHGSVLGSRASKRVKEATGGSVVVDPDRGPALMGFAP